MSLTDTINNTNTQKENIKIVATNIDNKLAELGGERATNLNDVPNKMEGMVGQYKRVAIVNPNTVVQEITSPYDLKINVNFPFTPSRVFVKIMYRYPTPYSKESVVFSNATIDSKYHKAIDFIPYDNNTHFQTTDWKDVDYLFIPGGKGISIIKHSNSQVVIRYKNGRNERPENDIKIQEILALE